ncbi:MAG: hypothetical protein LBC87_07330 [Fibromonadaceae bacterium]|jgi:hypothetical protein|nr:hypothetical protein [Fibromonadaceae bacterium]
MQKEDSDKFAEDWIETQHNVMCACINPRDWEDVREIIHDAFVAGFNKKCELNQIAVKEEVKGREDNLCK